MSPRDTVTAHVRGLLAGWTCEAGCDAARLPEWINCGECGAFADALVEQLVDEGLNAFTLATDDLIVDRCVRRRHPVEGVHVWAYVPEAGRHYDSEAPDGVEDWWSLPFFGRWRKRHTIERARSPEADARMLRATASAWAACRAEIARRSASRPA